MIGINKIKRIPELDSLRGIAAFCVMLYHYTTTFRPEFNYSFSEKFDFKYGHYGVQLFFLISGYVILMTVSKIRTIGEFAYKRFIRLYPTYWICLTITFGFIFLLPHANFIFTKRDIALNYLMFGGMFGMKRADMSYWSLVPELCFYLEIGILWMMKALRKPVIVCLIWALLLLLNFKIPFVEIILNFKFGMFFIIGMMFFVIQKEKGWLPHFVIFLSMITVYRVFDLEAFLFITGFVLIFYLLIHHYLGFLNIKVLLFLGKISYVLYLFHQTIGFLVIDQLMKFGISDYYSILLMIGISVLCSWFIYEFLEKPVLRRFSKVPLFLMKQK